MSEGHCLGDQVSEWAHARGVSLRSNYRATSLESLRHMVSAGEGMTLLPALAVVAPVPRFPGIALRRLEAPPPHRSIALVHPRTSPQTPTLEALAKALVPALETPPGDAPLVTPLPREER